VILHCEKIREAGYTVCFGTAGSLTEEMNESILAIMDGKVAGKINMSKLF